MNNFKDYGFEADFEGEILKELDNYLIGYVKHNYNIKSVIWYKRSGSLTNDYSLGSDFNLKPIKKEWYENIDCNKPAHFIDLETDTLGLAHGYNMNGDYCLNDFWKNSLSHISNARPATKEEVLSLLVKE